MLLERVDEEDPRRDASAPSGRWRRRATRSASSSAPPTPTSATRTSSSAATTSSSCATGCSASSPATRSRSCPRLDQPMIVIARDLSPADTAGMVREPVIAFITEIGTRTSHTAIMARALEIPARRRRRRRARRSIRTGDIAHRRRPARRGHRQPERDRRSRRRAGAAPGTSPSRAACSARATSPASRATASPSASRRTSSSRPRPSSRSTTAPRASASTAPSSSTSTARTMPTRGRAVRALSRGRRGGGAAARHAAHVRHRRRQVRVELPAPGRDEPGARPPRRAPGALAARRLPDAAPRDGPRERATAISASWCRWSRAFRSSARSARSSAARCNEVDARGPPAREAHPARHDDRGAERRRHGRRPRARGRVLQHRHERPHSVHAGDRPGEPVARAARVAVSPGHPADDPAGRRAPRRCTRVPVALCGAMASDPLAAVLLVGLGLRELSMEAAAIPEIKEALRRVTTTDCERAAEAALALDTAEAVEELVAGHVRARPLRPAHRDRGRLDESRTAARREHRTIPDDADVVTSPTRIRAAPPRPGRHCLVSLRAVDGRRR